MLVAHPTGSGPSVVGNDGWVTGTGSTLGGSVSVMGGSSGVVGPDTGMMGSFGCLSVSPMGGIGVRGISTNSAEQLTCGSPVVPGGHTHTGRCLKVWQLAFSPQIPREQTP